VRLEAFPRDDDQRTAAHAVAGVGHVVRGEKRVGGGVEVVRGRRLEGEAAEEQRRGPAPELLGLDDLGLEIVGQLLAAPDLALTPEEDRALRLHVARPLVQRNLLRGQFSGLALFILIAHQRS